MAAIIDDSCALVTERVRSGVKGLDEVFCGGFVRGNTILLQGPPGSAKTTLGTQILVNGFQRYGERAILLSFEQQPQQIIRNAAQFGWDLAGAEREGKLRILFVSPHDLYPSGGGDSPAATQVLQAQEAIGARRILIDSITFFLRMNRAIEELDRVFAENLATMRSLHLTPFLIAEEPNPDDMHNSHAAYVADTVINLHHNFDARAGRRRRWLEVVKSRGQICLEGRHPLKFTTHGIELFPRILPTPSVFENDKPQPPAMCKTGIDGLDRLLRGGLSRGSITIIAGPEGTAKTTLGSHFLAAGCAEDEKTLLLSFEETPGQLIENMKSRGLDLLPHAQKNRLAMMHLPGSGICLLETYYRLREQIELRKITRVVIDSMNDLLRHAADPQDEHYFLTLYNDLFRRNGVTAVLLEQIRPSTGLEGYAAVQHGSLVDCIILLGLREIEGRLAKTLVVMKSRNEIADSRFHEMVLTPEGAEVREAV